MGNLNVITVGMVTTLMASHAKLVHLDSTKILTISQEILVRKMNVLVQMVTKQQGKHAPHMNQKYVCPVITITILNRCRARSAKLVGISTLICLQRTHAHKIHACVVMEVQLLQLSAQHMVRAFASPAMMVIIWKDLYVFRIHAFAQMATFRL